MVNITGELVALGPLLRDLVPLYQRWMNDLVTARNLGRVGPLTHKAEQAWYDRAALSETNASFTIYDRATMQPVGTAQLMDIRHRNRRADFGISIGEPEFRGRGYGTEATQLMLDYAFTVVGLHNVALTVAEFNPAGIRAYEKAGFREFGRRKECWLMNGRLWDEIHMQCLSTWFESPVLGKLFAPEDPRT